MHKLYPESVIQIKHKIMQIYCFAEMLMIRLTQKDGPIKV